MFDFILNIPHDSICLISVRGWLREKTQPLRLLTRRHKHDVQRHKAFLPCRGQTWTPRHLCRDGCGSVWWWDCRGFSPRSLLEHYWISRCLRKCPAEQTERVTAWFICYRGPIWWYIGDRVSYYLRVVRDIEPYILTVTDVTVFDGGWRSLATDTHRRAHCTQITHGRHHQTLNRRVSEIKTQFKISKYTWFGVICMCMFYLLRKSN